jgi:hypothetical protein
MEKKLAILRDYATHNGKGFEAIALLFGHLNKYVNLAFSHNLRITLVSPKGL